MLETNPTIIDKKCHRWEQEDKWYLGRHKVTINLDETGEEAVVSWRKGGIVPRNYDRICVKRHPFTFFGIFKVASFEDRINIAVSEMQKRCDYYDAVKLEEREYQQLIKNEV